MSLPQVVSQAEWQLSRERLQHERAVHEQMASAGGVLDA